MGNRAIRRHSSVMARGVESSEWLVALVDSPMSRLTVSSVDAARHFGKSDAHCCSQRVLVRVILRLRLEGKKCVWRHPQSVDALSAASVQIAVGLKCEGLACLWA